MNTGRSGGCRCPDIPEFVRICQCDLPALQEMDVNNDSCGVFAEYWEQTGWNTVLPAQTPRPCILTRLACKPLAFECNLQQSCGRWPHEARRGIILWF